jgi:glutamine amidotransferase
VTIAVVDYGAGNLASVHKALAAAGATVHVPRRPADLKAAAGIVVPGVGHFRATAALDAAWRDAIREHLAASRPLLGICLGMQWLFEGSDEAPELAGLGVFAGRVARLAGAVKVPHVGWNALDARRPSWLLAGVPDGAQVYFTHGYAAPVTAEAVATTTYGIPFAAAVERGWTAGVQFHPEKSGAVGLRILRNFVHAVETTHRVSRRA